MIPTFVGNFRVKDPVTDVATGIRGTQCEKLAQLVRAKGTSVLMELSVTSCAAHVIG